MIPSDPTATPATSSASSATFARRPVATSTTVLRASLRPPSRRIDATVVPPSGRRRSTVAPVTTVSPSRAKARASAADASGSSRGSRRGARPTIVTREPSRANAWPNSQPIGPPPRTSSEAGSVVRPKIVSFVWYTLSPRPASGGSAGWLPVATM